MRTTVGYTINDDLLSEPSRRLTKREIIMPMTRQINDQLLSRILTGRWQALDLEFFSPTDWDHLIRMTRTGGVAPLVYWNLSRSGELVHLPETLAKSLQAAYISTKLNNEQLIREMETLAGLFAEAGIPVIVLKGACYALTIYPDIGLRPMADLDLLVPAAKLPEAAQIASACDYAEAVPEMVPGLTDLLGHHVCLKKCNAPFTTLELHHSLVAGRSFDYAVPVEWFWSQTEPLDRIGPRTSVAPLRMLTPTAQLLYACSHAMLQHGGRNIDLRWIYDIDRLIRVYADRIDWSTLLTQARFFEWTSAVEAGLSRTIAFFGTPVPQGVMTELHKGTDQNAALVVGLQNQPMSYVQEVYQNMQSLNWYLRFRLALALATPGPAYMRWRYGLKNYWVLPVWYLYRWWNIFRDLVKTVWSLARKAVAQGGISGSPFRSPDKNQ